MLLLLQRRGRTTARQLAETFEISERTVLRDVEALSEAGVPIFTARGAGGGIELMEGFQTHLTGLTRDEARSLFLVGQPEVAHRLGLSAPTRAARGKLLSALSTSLSEEADQLSTWFVHDPDPWNGNHIPHGELRRLARSVHERRRVELTFAGTGADAGPVTVQPLGLVLKAGSWYLVSAAQEAIEVVCIDDLRATRLTNLRFLPLPGFELAEFWNSHTAAPRRVKCR